jgi:hypothetical protein
MVAEAPKYIDIRWIDYYDVKDIEVDYIDVYFRRGDLGTRKDMQVVGLIDYREQLDGFEISNRMKEIYLVASIPKSWRQTVLDRVIESEDEKTEDRWVLDKDMFSVDFRSKLYKNDETEATNTLIDNVVIIDEMIINDYIKNVDKFNKVKDINAWVGGAVTVGSAGTYATWVALAADIGTFTSNGTATMISNLTQVAQATFTNTIGIYDMVFNGDQNLLTISHSGSGINWQSEGSSTGNKVMNFKTRRLTNGLATVRAAFEFASIGNTHTINIHHNRIDGNNLTGAGIRPGDGTVILNIYSNIIFDCGNYGMFFSGGTGNASNKYENLTVLNSGIGIQVNNNAGSMIDIAVFDCATDYSNTGFLSTFSKCASSDATGSEVGLQNLTAATVLQSLVDTSDVFLWPVRDESLFGTGVDPTIVGHTTYYNGVTILTDDVDIGANGLEVRVLLDTLRRILTTQIKIGSKIGNFC